MDYFKERLENTDYFRNLPKEEKGGIKTINTIKHFLKSLGDISPEIYDTLNDINILSSGITRHRYQDIRDKVNEVFKKYKIDIINPNFSLFWFKILDLFNRVLLQLYHVIKNNP